MRFEKRGSSHRQANYDLLRAVSCVTVVLLHVSAMYVGEKFRDIVERKQFIIASCFRIMSQMSVPCFVMLSGAFLLKQEKNANCKYFYLRSARKIGIPILVFSVLYVVFHYVENLLGGGSGLIASYRFDAYGPVINWLKGEPHATMWYVYMIVPLYLLTPFLIMIKNSVTERGWYIAAMIMMAYSILVSYTCSLSWILRFAEWIGYFMMGDVISDWGNKRVDLKISRHPLICICLAYLMLFMYWLTHTYRTMRLSGPGFLSPFNVVPALLLFLGFTYLQINENMAVQLLSRYSFYIYLIHPFLCEILMQTFGRILKWFPPVWFILILVPSITALCIFIKWSFDAVVKRIVSRKA